MYVKSLHNSAVYRGEKSLTLSLPLVDAINSIILPMNVINDLRNEVRELSRKFDLLISNKFVLSTDLQ